MVSCGACSLSSLAAAEVPSPLAYACGGRLGSLAVGEDEPTVYKYIRVFVFPVSRPQHREGVNTFGLCECSAPPCGCLHQRTSRAKNLSTVKLTCSGQPIDPRTARTGTTWCGRTQPSLSTTMLQAESALWRLSTKWLLARCPFSKARSYLALTETATYIVLLLDGNLLEDLGRQRSRSCRPIFSSSCCATRLQPDSGGKQICHQSRVDADA